VLEGSVEVCLFSKRYNFSKNKIVHFSKGQEEFWGPNLPEMLMINVRINSEESLQNCFCNHHKIFGKWNT